jgi:hypothetical protein
VETRINAAGDSEILVGQSWLPIDWTKVIDRPGPDDRIHVCWSPYWPLGGTMIPIVRCIILPGDS